MTTTALAKDLRSYALCGPPYGRVWEPEPWQKEKYKIIRSLVPNDWTMLTPVAPGQTDRVAADLAGKSPDSTRPQPPTAPAWRGTLLPKTETDVWLTAGFAQCERLIALENALRVRSDGTLSNGDREAARRSAGSTPVELLGGEGSTTRLASSWRWQFADASRTRIGSGPLASRTSELRRTHPLSRCVS